MKRLVVVLAAGCLLGGVLPGCGMDLPTGVLLERPRVLGVRVIAESDPELAQPVPGESTTLRWLTAPGTTGWTYALTACVARPSTQGLPQCEGEPFAVGFGMTPSAEPEWTFTVPAGAAGTLLVAGVLCADGTPALPSEGETLPGCDGENATTEILTFSVALAGMGPINRHPEWTDDAFTIDEMAWPIAPADLGDTGCLGRDGVPQISRRLPTMEDGEEVEPDPSELGYTVRSQDRETFEALVLGDPPFFEEQTEELTITHVATQGNFVRLRSVVFDQDSETNTVQWEHPDEEDLPEVPTDGLTVRVWHVLRDGRGGMSIAQRAFCLIP